MNNVIRLSTNQIRAVWRTPAQVPPAVPTVRALPALPVIAGVFVVLCATLLFALAVR
jgi:hypothetical protein